MGEDVISDDEVFGDVMGSDRMDDEVVDDVVGRW